MKTYKCQQCGKDTSMLLQDMEGKMVCLRCKYGQKGYPRAQHRLQADVAFCACKPAAVGYARVCQDCRKCGKSHRR